MERVKSKVNSKIDNKIDNLNEIRDILSGFFVPKTNKEIENLLEDSRIKNNISAYSDMLLGMKYSSALDISQNGYHRINLTSELVGRFIGGITMQLNKECPALSIVEVKDDIRKEIEVLKTITYESQILSPKLKIAEFRGKEIVKKIFETLTKENGYELLPNDVRETFDFVKTNEVLRNRIICDYIAGMTDKYAIEFYGRLTSENPETIFKPF